MVAKPATQDLPTESPRQQAGAGGGHTEGPFFGWSRPLLKGRERRSKGGKRYGYRPALSGPGARYDFSTLAGLSGAGPAKLSDRLWREVWRGKVTNDSFACLRHGIENNFRVKDPEALIARGSRRRRDSQGTAFLCGRARSRWRELDAYRWPKREEELLERAEHEKSGCGCFWTATGSYSVNFCKTSCRHSFCAISLGRFG